MALEPSASRRVRNKPGEWWAVAPSPASQPADTHAQKIPHSKDLDNVIVDSDDVTSRRQKRKRKRTGIDEEDEAGSDAVELPSRRTKRPDVKETALDGRSTQKETVRVNQSGTNAERGKRRAGKDQSHKETAAGSRSSNVPASSGTSTGNLEIARRGRSSNTEAELKAIKYKEAATRKLKQPEQVPAQIASIFQKVQNPRGIDQQTQSQPDIIRTNESLGRRRGRSSNTAAELKAVNYKEAKTVVRQNMQQPEAARHLSSSASQHRSSGGCIESQRRPPINGKRGRPSLSSQFEKRQHGIGGAQSSPQLATGQPKSKGNRQSKVSAKKQIPAVRTSSSKLVDPQRETPLRKSSQLGVKSQIRKAAHNGQSSLKRRKSQLPDMEEEEQADPGYQRLAATTRKISRAVIDSEWDSLPRPCVDRISQLLQDTQKPVLARLKDQRQLSQAGSALRMISRRLIGKISKGLPFPPSTRTNREDDFDYEKILDQNRDLEQQLTPTLHANSLLEAELAKEVSLWEAEQDYLAELESNSKAEASKRKQNFRKLHSLLHHNHEITSTNFQDNIGLLTSDAIRYGSGNEHHLDESLQAVVNDLLGHVDSMDGNFKQIEGITQAVARTKAAVQSKLLDDLGSKQYEEVILGSRRT